MKYSLYIILPIALLATWACGAERSHWTVEKAISADNRFIEGSWIAESQADNAWLKIACTSTSKPMAFFETAGTLHAEPGEGPFGHINVSYDQMPAASIPTHSRRTFIGSASELASHKSVTVTYRTILHDRQTASFDVAEFRSAARAASAGCLTRFQ